LNIKNLLLIIIIGLISQKSYTNEFETNLKRALESGKIIIYTDENGNNYIMLTGKVGHNSPKYEPFYKAGICVSGIGLGISLSKENIPLGIVSILGLGLFTGLSSKEEIDEFKENINAIAVTNEHFIPCQQYYFAEQQKIKENTQK